MKQFDSLCEAVLCKLNENTESSSEEAEKNLSVEDIILRDIKEHGEIQDERLRGIYGTELGVCPVCDGEKKVNGKPCMNCGGQVMFGKPKGYVPLRNDGTPCKHEYTPRREGTYATRYVCAHCPNSYVEDSGG